jgi:spermidine/putrescine-binding protein
MKKFIDKLKKIENIVESNTDKILTTDVATNIYEVTNELMADIKKPNQINFTDTLIELEEQFHKETEMIWWRSPNVFMDWLKERN